MADLASLFIKVDSKGVVTASKDLNKLTDDSKKTETATEGVTRGFSKLQAVVVALASSYALLKMAQYIKDTALLAARYETLGVVMRVVGKNAGYSGSQMESFARGLQKSGIAMIESRNTLARMIQAQIDLTSSQKLARIAQNAAVIGNMNSSAAFEHMIYGLQTGMPRILRTIGLNVNFDASIRALADSLGIKRKAMSEVQVMQGRVNAVIKAGILIEGAYEGAMETAGKKLTSFIRYVDDFKVKMGKAFGPATVMLVDAATQAMKEFQDEISRPEAQEALRELSSQLATVIIQLGQDLPKAIKTLTYMVSALASAFESLALSFHIVTFRGDKLYQVLKKVKDELWDTGLEFHKIDRSTSKFLSQYEKMQEILSKGITTRLDFALEDPDKYYGALSDIAKSVYKQTEETKKRYAKYYADLEEMEENADIKAIMRERERLAELEPFIAARHESWLSAYEVEEARLAEYASYRTSQEKSIAEQIKAIRMEDKAFALADLQERYENYKNFTDDLIGLELWYAATKKGLEEDKYSDMKNAMMGWANNFSSTLNDMLWGAEVTFKSILESFMKMITQTMIQMAIIEPLVAGITGGGILESITSLFSAQGNVFSQSGLQPFAQGGIVNKPTHFAFAGGVGLMGEAGPEAIMPLTRTSKGDLGVKAEGGNQKQTVNVIMNNPTFQDLETQRQVMAQIASIVAAQVAPGAVVENYDNDGAVRSIVRGGM